jgi:rhodanese-related sulfurtransferase
MTHRIRALVAALAVVTTLAGCSGDSSDARSNDVAAAVSVDAVLIDVRTPEEFAAGHLQGAVLIDIQDPTFDARIAELDPAGQYVVYCRSGNRSAQAVKRMQSAGITNITDLGSLENASSKTGIAIVAG